MRKQDPKAAAGDLFAAVPRKPTLFERMAAASGFASREDQDPNGHMAETMPARAVADPVAGEERAAEGIAAAAANADNSTLAGLPIWSGRAWLYAERWVKAAHPSVKFAVEDIRLDFEEAGNPPPPNNNAWGSIGRRLIAEKLAERTGGYRAARIKTSNGRAVALYRRA